MIATAEFKRFLSESDDHPELQLPKHQKNESRAEEVQWRIDCAEIYFLLRITDVASRMKMKRAWALDLTTEVENGNPLDFSVAS